MIYFDNSATTELCYEAKQAISDVIEQKFGNPSSLHRIGLDAEHVIEDARIKVWQSLGLRGPVKKSSLIFTSGGSEANNLALLGSAYAKNRKGTPKLITGSGEHSSIEEAVKLLESRGWEICRLGTAGGKLDLEELQRELTPNTAIVSIMAVNNETGAIYDTKSAFSLARQLCPNAVLHTDAVQAYEKLSPKDYMNGADLVSISAHKIHGPKGAGALYVSPDIVKARKLSPIIYGGGQENGMRSGTENTIGIAGFGAAASVMTAKLPENQKKLADLHKYLIDKLTSEIGDKIILNLPEKSASHILNFTVPNIRSETMLHYLEQYDIYLSVGSACSSHASKVSRALSAFGIDDINAQSSLRLSLCENNTYDEIDTFITRLCGGISTLAKIK